MRPSFFRGCHGRAYVYAQRESYTTTIEYPDYVSVFVVIDIVYTY